MLCLSGFELYSLWVPLLKLQDVGACIFHPMQWFQSYEVPPPLGHYCSWEPPPPPIINNNLTLLGSEIRFIKWPSRNNKGTRTRLLFYLKRFFFSLGESCEWFVIFFCSPVAKWQCMCRKTFNEGVNKALKDSLPSFW